MIQIAVSSKVIEIPRAWRFFGFDHMRAALMSLAALLLIQICSAWTPAGTSVVVKSGVRSSSPVALFGFGKKKEPATATAPKSVNELKEELSALDVAEERRQKVRLR